jgi:dienelactone hydrolase
MPDRFARRLRRQNFVGSLWAVLIVLASASGGATRVSAGASAPMPPRLAGVASDSIGCLQVPAGRERTASGRVTLRWQGQADRARLAITVAGSEAAHTIRLNGQKVATAPIFPYGTPCGEGRAFVLDVPIELVKQGSNEVTISNDRRPDDAWSALGVRLEVWGVVSPPPVTAGVEPQLVSTLAVSATISFTNPYDGSSQPAIIQIPDGYNNTPTPLVIFAHGRYGTQLDGYLEFGGAANAKNWLLASPELHGRWQGVPPPPTPGAFAYASLESQYDILGTLIYMAANYNVDRSRVYLVGYSMGGQIAVVTAGKYPHLFAAVYDNKGPTDFAAWYDEQVAFYGDENVEQVLAMRQECHLAGAPQPPSGNPFCYQRRSGLNFARNLIHVPISITHHISDTLVPVTHSTRLRDAINAFGPDQTVTIGFDTSSSGCGTAFHNCVPSPTAVLDFFAPRTLNNLPYTLNISSDESKPYYWLNINQLTGDRWTQIQATYAPATNTITAVVSDTQSVQIGLNVGTTPITGPAGFSQPGLGISARLYRITVGGNPPYLAPYVSGYLTMTAPSGQTSLTVTPVYPVYLPVVSKGP